MKYGYTARTKERRSAKTGRAVFLLAGTAVAVVLGSINAQAQTNSASDVSQPQRRAFNIPAQPLSAAIGAFGRQSGLQVTLSSAAAGSVRTNAVTGSFTTSEALSRLLNGTGVAYRFSGNGAVVIGSSNAASNVAAEDGTTVLETITVTGKADRNAATGSGFQGTPDWVYETPASVSVVSQEAIQNSGARSARDVLDHVTGVQVNRSESQKPGVQVNIRGLQDQNRIVSMIDGARQNFQRNGHGGSQQVFVDSSFIRSVEIEKVSGSGVGGAGSLGGSVNFRTVGADDVIKSGERWGGTLTGGSGTNAFNFDGNVITGIRLSDDFSILGGVSRKRLGEYKAGKSGRPLTRFATFIDNEVLSSGFDSVGTLLKLEASPVDDVDLDLSWVRYDINSSLSSQSVLGSTPQPRRDDMQDYRNNTVTSSLSWDPASELADVKARLWLNDTNNDELRDYRNEGGVIDPVGYSMRSWGGSIENTSSFTMPYGKFSLNYGVEAFRDSGETDVTPRVNASGIDESYGYRGMNPSGGADNASGFLNATYEHEQWLTLRGGLRYDYSGIEGTTQLAVGPRTVIIAPAVCILRRPNGTCARERPAVEATIPAQFTMVDVDRSADAWLPSFSVSVKPFDWLQPFVNYNESHRPPSIMETLFSGGHPNVSPVDNMPNANLRAEEGETWEVGANIQRDGVIRGDDSFRMKAMWFRRDITNYISLGKVYYPLFGKTYDTHVNLDGVTRMQGLEIEANYDVGFAYGGLSYTRTNTDLAGTYTYDGPAGGGLFPGSINGARPSVIFIVPKERFSLDAGMRLFDERFVVGGRMTYVQQAQPKVGDLARSYFANSYRVYDVYGSYAFNENTKLRFSVNNVTDESYWPSLGTEALPAPGRTFTASLNVKF